MFKKSRWKNAGTLVRGWKARQGMEDERMLILNQIWEREAGGFARHWALDGVRRGILYVKVTSPAAAQELQMRGTGIVKSLNKHFKRSWIKAIKTSRG